METLKLGKNLLIEKNLNLLVLENQNKIIFESNSMGIRPMYEFYEKNVDKEVYIIDKFIGSGAARLIINSRSKIKGVFTFVISKSALKIFEDHNVFVIYESVVDRILNKKKDDLCPIEKISLKNEKFEDFYVKLTEFIGNMK